MRPVKVAWANSHPRSKAFKFFSSVPLGTDSFTVLRSGAQRDRAGDPGHESDHDDIGRHLQPHLLCETGAGYGEKFSVFTGLDQIGIDDQDGIGFGLTTVFLHIRTGRDRPGYPEC